MVGPAGIRWRQRRGAHIPERGEPGAEDRTRGFVPLHMNSAHLSAPVVVVEVDGKLLRLGFENDRTGDRICRACLPFSEMILHVRCRTQEAFFLAAPEPDADGA